MLKLDTIIDHLKTELLTAIESAPDIPALESIRIEALGKKGRLTQMMKSLGEMDPEERKQAGQTLNAFKDRLAEAIEIRRVDLEEKALRERLQQEAADVTLPAPKRDMGRLHPTNVVMDELIDIFGTLGFDVAEGPDIDDDFHNFEALNFAPDHPARQEHDTFYLPPNDKGDPMLLRTHTSTVQIRTMVKQQPPIRIIAPGRTFRADSDATHSPMFHQLEGLVIDKTTHMGHMKDTIISFCRTFFGIEDLRVRLRASYFPFVEPGAEVDIGCSREGGQLKIGPGKDWLEILGCGMVHPNVIRNCGLDPEVFQGFAFGMGIDRLAMLKYGIPDLRTFFESDLRWLKHYGFLGLQPPSLVRGF